MDVNPNSVRILAACVDMEAKRARKSPWTPHPMTLVGKTRLACRYISPADELVVRVVEAHEMMRMIGWDPL
eukprot:12400267-Karenia_brevis.AAC.1